MYDSLKKVLSDRGISVYRLSFMADISSPDLYNALNGNRPMYPNWRKRISKALEVNEDVLFDREVTQ